VRTSKNILVGIGMKKVQAIFCMRIEILNIMQNYYITNSS